MKQETGKISKEKQELLACALSVGTILSKGKRKYRIEEVLGAGSYGITYKVSAIVSIDNVVSKTTMAIKEYFPKGCFRGQDNTTMKCAPTMQTDVSESRRDFLIEAKRLNKLSGISKNIVRVNEFFEENDTAYYVMEFLDGGTLGAIVEKGGAMAESEALEIIRCVTKAVGLLHAENVLHLDIKPDNIVMKTDPISGETYPVLIDFGIAKHFDRKGKPTSNRMAKGATEGYAPIEQYTEISHFAPEIDIYALGATLFYLLTAKHPQKSFEITSELIKTALSKRCSSSTQNAVAKAMMRMASERTPSTDAFLANLNNDVEIKPIVSPISRDTVLLRNRYDGHKQSRSFFSVRKPTVNRNYRPVLRFAIPLLICVGLIVGIWSLVGGASPHPQLSEDMAKEIDSADVSAQEKDSTILEEEETSIVVADNNTPQKPEETVVPNREEEKIKSSKTDEKHEEIKKEEEKQSATNEQPADEDKVLNQTVNGTNLNSIISLAKKGNRQAAAKLANYYMNIPGMKKENLDQAYSWSLKSDASTKSAVHARLEALDYPFP